MIIMMILTTCEVLLCLGFALQFFNIKDCNKWLEKN